jgi:tape measure domain-containing protein
MAGNDVVGALYYKVVLDPRDYAKGVTQVKSEQAVLARAISSSVSDFDRLQAELDAIGAMYIKSSEEHRQVLQAAQAEIIRQMEELVDAEERAAQIAEQNKAAEAEKEQVDAIQRTMDKIEEKNDLIQQLAQIQEKTAKDLNKEIEDAEAERIKNQKQLEKDAADRHKKRYDERYKNIFRYFRSFEGFRKLMSHLANDFFAINGGMSKFAGNIAQMAGLSPAMQGLARAFGAVSVPLLAIAVAAAATLKAFTAVVKKIDAYQKQLIRMKVLLNGNAQLTANLMDRMMTLAAQTGFASQTMFELAESLMNVGISAMSVQRVGMVLAGLAGGSEERLKSIAKAYQDVMMKGRLMGQEALQFANAGIPIYKALADMLNVTTGQVRTMMEEGKISAEQMSMALQAFASERDITGQIAQNMRTVSGQIARAKVLFDQLIINVTGSGLNEFLADTVRQFNKMLQFINAHLVSFKMLGGAITAGFTTVVGMIPFIGKHLQTLIRLAGILKSDPKMSDHEAMMEALRKQDEANKQAEEDDRKRDERKKAAFGLLKKQLQMEYVSEERRARAEYQSFVVQQDITDEAKKQLMAEYDKLEAMREQQKTKRETIEEERSRLEDIVNKEADRKRKAISEATSRSGAGFSAGSAGEFKFLRDLIMGRRQNTEELKVLKDQDAKLKVIADNSDAQLSLLDDQQKAFDQQVLPVGGP